MPDVLKQTLYWSGNPTHTLLTDMSGLASFTGTITAAGSHDASDASLAVLAAPDDNAGELNGDATGSVANAIDTASVTGPISFLRVKYRGKRNNVSDVSASIQPRINGVDRGSPSALGTSFTDYSQDFATDPADSNAWTNAKVNAQTFGVLLGAISTHPTWLRTAESQLSEFSVELWGPDVQTASPAAAGVLAGVGTASLVAGLVALSVDAAPVAAVPGTPTLAPGPVMLAVEAAASDTMVFDEAWIDEGWNPLAPKIVDAFVDAGVTPIRIVRSDTAPFGDGSDATKTLLSSPGSWPNSGTLTFDFHGTVGDTSLDGSGAIAGVKVYVRLRARKDTNAVLNNFRCEFSGLTKQFLAQPTVWPMLPAAGYYETLVTDLILLTSNNVPFEWGQGVNSIFTQATMGWRAFADYSVGGAFAGQFAQVEVADAWLEVYGYNGTKPEVVALKVKVGNLRRVQVMQSVVEEV